MVQLYRITLVVALVAAVSVVIIFYLHGSFAKKNTTTNATKKKEAFVIDTEPNHTKYKLCSSQNACASPEGVHPEVCSLPKAEGANCCKYDSDTKSCQSKYTNPDTVA